MSVMASGRMGRTMTTRAGTAVWLAVVILSLAAAGCQWGIGVGAAPTPRPPATPMPPNTPVPPVARYTPAASLTPAAPVLPPTPTLEERRMPVGVRIGNNTKVIDGNLHVWYIPCPPSPPATWVAPIILSDLDSGSHVYLNRDGTIKESPEPVYLTEEGREVIEAAFKDSSVVEQIVDRPECPDGLK